jgi:hypothetical protein
MKSRVNRARAELAQLLSIEGPEDFQEDPIITPLLWVETVSRRKLDEPTMEGKAS